MDKLLENFLNEPQSYTVRQMITPKDQETILKNRIECMGKVSKTDIGQAMLNVVDKTPPTDYCKIEKDLVEKLLWREEDTESIVLSGTVPIPNILLRLPWSLLTVEKDSSETLDVRVCLFESYDEAIEEGLHSDPKDCIFGVILIGEDLLSDVNSYSFGFLLCYAADISKVTLIPSPLTRNLNDNFMLHEFYRNNTDKDLHGLFRYFYRIWYGVQMSLLHPKIKTIYKSEGTIQTTQTVRTSKKKGKPLKRQIKNIKRIVIDTREVKELEKTKRDFIRSTFAWYVSGHWRTYKKSGKKVWIDGYWKGALRETKKAEAEIRERVIVKEDKNDQINNAG